MEDFEQEEVSSSKGPLQFSGHKINPAYCIAAYTKHLLSFYNSQPTLALFIAHSSQQQFLQSQPNQKDPKFTTHFSFSSPSHPPQHLVDLDRLQRLRFHNSSPRLLEAIVASYMLYQCPLLVPLSQSGRIFPYTQGICYTPSRLPPLIFTPPVVAYLHAERTKCHRPPPV